MTRIADLFGDGPTVSFEFFPPKTEEGRAQLAEVRRRVGPHRSDVRVGHLRGRGDGARCDPRSGRRDRPERPFPAMPHLACIGHTRAELSGLLDDYADAGIDNILALAGDPPSDGSPAIGDFTYASELVGTWCGSEARSRWPSPCSPGPPRAR